MRLRMFAGVIALVTIAREAPAGVIPTCSTNSINRKICGTLLDYTHNSCHDRRIWSPALCQYRDLYVYLPPGYDPNGCYPLLIWLHSYTTDEREFARDVVQSIDRAIACGKLPPMVIAAPDGSLFGGGLLPLGSWYVNSPRGCFADYIMQDVIGFMEQNFAVCRERDGRAIAGFSMGGFGAFNLGLKHQDKFKLVAGISPAVNPRYQGANRDYFADFDPTSWFLREDFRPMEIVGKFYGGLLKIRAFEVVEPVWGKGPCAIERASQENPTELLDRLDVKPGGQDYFIAYGKRDELNVDAQVESFLYVTKQRGIEVETHCDPCGHHNRAFLVSALPDLITWLSAHVRYPGCDGSRRPPDAAPATAISDEPCPPRVTRTEAVVILPRTRPIADRPSESTSSR